MMTKTELRKHYRDLRSNLSETDEAALNLALLNQLKSLEWQHVKFCHVFLPISKYHEPNTFLLISYLQEQYPHIQLVVSRSDLASNVMSHYHYSDTVTLVHNKWGILEPTDGISVNEKSIDMVLVPLLISDIFGHRVGYGKGYYDRFLALCRPDVQKVGLSFFEPIGLIEDIDVHDIPLDICVTPTAVYHY
ncbi:5-formyltetrahydrofolate cyclo-ligase [Sphingobacterium sp. ML3W]|uniref:5-formyltetrahydrofolate cyclo-ligase n=1 Tax=Sphingobacterium sp. ML3W TaxID=1538644 RepID=UPI001F4522C6|nr:5-formyltetrahydrofolate cyclo-ligase [Sphingobacterium sp. ML3W]